MNNDMGLITVLKAVDEALYKYDPGNIDVVKDEATNMLDIFYHNRRNSFPVASNIANFADVNIKELEKRLDHRDVGYIDFAECSQS